LGIERIGDFIIVMRVAIVYPGVKNNFLYALERSAWNAPGKELLITNETLRLSDWKQS
jgi:hypothetical protein